MACPIDSQLDRSTYEQSENRPQLGTFLNDGALYASLRSFIPSDWASNQLITIRDFPSPTRYERHRDFEVGIDGAS